nr:MAG TPA: tail tape measure protein [Caudoviricetes sp.]
MIDLTAVIDNEEAIRKFRELRNIARNATTSVVTDADRMDYAMQRFAATLGKIGVGVSLAGLVRQIAATRGEFQQLEVAFTTLLQNKEKADALMAEMVDLAAKTPFDLKGVADGARQLLAYGFAAEDITGTLTRLGNVAAGLGLPLERLTYLYGTTAVQGRLYARDMLQFTSSGIPVLQEMAKMYGKTTEEINEMVSAGKIGFEDVKKVIEGMTNEGGQFYNLMQEQSKTITGLISNLGDALDTMFNDIGKSQEGIISNVLQGTISLVENYQKVLDILVPLVATYGTYRAALIATAAIEKVQATITATKAILEQTKMLTRATQAQILFNKAVKANPYVLAASALVGLVTLIYQFSDGGYNAAKAQKDLNESIANASAGAIAEQRELARLKGELEGCTEGTKEYEETKKKIIDKFGQYDSSLKQEALSVQTLTEKYSSLSQAIMDSYNARQYEQFSASQSKQLEETITKNLDKLYNRLLKEVGDEKGAELYAKIRDSIISGQELDDDIIAVLDRIQNKGTIIADSRIDSWIKNIREAQKLADETDAQARRRFGINTPQKQNENESPKNEVQNKVAAVHNKAYWENLKKEAQGAIDAMDISLKGTAEWKKLEAQIVEYDAKIKQFNTSDKTVKSVSDAQKKLAELILANDRALEQSRLDIMKDGLNKELAEIDFQTEQRKQAISKAREEEKEASGGKLTNEREQDFATQMANLEVKANNERIAAREKYAEEYNKISKQITDSTLSEEERKYQSIKDEYEGFRKWAETAKEGGGITPDQVKELEEKIKQAETTKTLKAIVDEYGTAEDKITEIHEKAEKARQVATENGRSDLIAKIAQWEKDQISAIEASVIEQSDLWKQLLGDLDRMTTDQLQEAISQARQLIANSTNLSIQDTQALLGSVENAYKKLTTRNPFKALKDAYDRYHKALKSENKDGVTSAWADVQTATQSVKSNISEITQIASSLGGILGNEVGDGISKVGSLTNDLITVFEGFGGGGASTPGGIMAWVQAGMNVATTIIGLFDDSARQAEIQAEKNRQLEGTWDSINYQVERYIDLLETAGGSEYFENAEKALSSIQKGIDLAIQSLTDFPTVAADKFTHALRVISSSSFGEKVRPSVLGITQEEYEALKRISKVLQSGDKDAIIALKENEDFWKLLPEWIQQGIDKLIDYDDQLKKTQEDINKDLFQTTTSDMEDAIISWLKNVKDGSDEASEYLEDAMRDALLESFKIEQLRPRLQEFYKKYAQYADTDQDNKLDLTADEISKLREEWKDIIDWSKEQTEGIRDVIGESSSLSAQTASTRGYQVMSQDEGEEMNGRLSDVQAKTGNILAAVEFVKSLSAEQLNRTTDIRDIMIQLNGNVADIRSYTRVLPTMNETLTSMNRKLDNL